MAVYKQPGSIRKSTKSKKPFTPGTSPFATPGNFRGGDLSGRKVNMVAKSMGTRGFTNGNRGAFSSSAQIPFGSRPAPTVKPKAKKKGAAASSKLGSRIKY